MRELLIVLQAGEGGRVPALDVSLVPGIPDLVDEAAANADPAHAFLRASWFRAAGGDCATLVARRPDGRVVAALPTRPLHRLTPLARAVPGCYWPLRSFPIAADISDAELAAFLAAPAARRALGTLWRVGPVPEDDPTAARLVPAARAAGWRVLKRTLATSFVLDVEALRAQGAWPRSSTLKKNRWFERQLAAQGELRFRFATGGDWTEELFDTLAAIERSSCLPTRTDARDAKFLAPQHRAFWEKACRDPQIAARMWAVILYVGEAPAAFSFDLDCGSTRYAIANSYDARFARNSPGRLVCYRNFERLSERGIRRIDWGAGDPGYKETMGAAPAAAVVDYVFTRSAVAAALAPGFAPA
jgi:CelD/BcsL family acetyltransferase involved in cellulose biosynthesis